MSIFNIGSRYPYDYPTYTTLPCISSTSLYSSIIPCKTIYLSSNNDNNDDTSDLDPDIIEFLKLKQQESKKVIKGLREEIEQLKKQKDALEKEFSDYKNNLDKKISEKVKEEIGKSIRTPVPSKTDNDLPTVEDVTDTDAEMSPAKISQPCIPPPSILNS
jgi:hypothetical protein